MLSEAKVKRLYEDQLNRAVGYYHVAVSDATKKELYESHVWTLCRIGKILEIPEEDTFSRIREKIKK
jgi:hypothetical protein